VSRPALSRPALSRLSLAAAFALALAGAAHAAAGGPIGTLMLGRYDCERPGNAGGALAEVDPKTSFTVVTASRYVAGETMAGTYLLRGDTVTMTSGPLAGTRLLRRNGKFLRRIEADGTPGALRCVLARESDLR
jgi:hypothetical protein